jgi:phospho-N-acetylmuramoyl-pentapeptide-transferase
MLALDAIKILMPMALAFFIGILITRPLLRFLYTHECWKKKAGKKGYAGGETPIFNALHKEKEVGTPRMGGVVVWGSVSATILGMWLLTYGFGGATLEKFEFLSRSQTWLPFMALLVGALVGLADDILEVRGTGAHFAGGLPLSKRLIAVGAVCLFAGWWFYEKLGVSGIAVPFDGMVSLGIFFIPFFVLVGLAIYAGGVIDGIDGLAGGVFAMIFGAYGVIAFAQHQIDLAAFCATVTGGLLAFLWFNVPPAKFYLSETGVMGLTLALTIVAFMTDALGGGKGLFALPVIALPLVITMLSDVIQVLSKKFRKKKVFLVAPVHHHFEALGVPAHTVTMRYWIFGIICAFLGVIAALAGGL